MSCLSSFVTDCFFLVHPGRPLSPCVRDVMLFGRGLYSSCASFVCRLCPSGENFHVVVFLHGGPSVV